MRTRQEVGIFMVCLETITDFIEAKGHGRQDWLCNFQGPAQEDAGLLVKNCLHFQDGDRRTVEKHGTLLSKGQCI